MKAENYLIKYETILEMLEDGPISMDDVVYNLEQKYTKKQIFDTLSRMETKKYIKFDEGKKILKVRDVSTFS
jgi:hypothetical protein